MDSVSLLRRYVPYLDRPGCRTTWTNERYATRRFVFPSSLKTADDNSYEEILVTGRRAFWSSMGCLRRIISFPSDVRSFLRASFSPQQSSMNADSPLKEKRDRFILFVLKKELKLVSLSRKSDFIVSLPFVVSRVVNIPGGILLVAASSRRQGSYVFSMTSQFAVEKPVMIASGTTRKGVQSSQELFSISRHAFSHERVPILLTLSPDSTADFWIVENMLPTPDSQLMSIDSPQLSIADIKSSILYNMAPNTHAISHLRSDFSLTLAHSAAVSGEVVGDGNPVSFLLLGGTEESPNMAIGLFFGGIMRLFRVYATLAKDYEEGTIFSPDLASVEIVMAGQFNCRAVCPISLPFFALGNGTDVYSNFITLEKDHSVTLHYMNTKILTLIGGAKGISPVVPQNIKDPAGIVYDKGDIHATPLKDSYMSIGSQFSEPASMSLTMEEFSQQSDIMDTGLDTSMEGTIEDTTEERPEKQDFFVTDIGDPIGSKITMRLARVGSRGGPGGTGASTGELYWASISPLPAKNTIAYSSLKIISTVFGEEKALEFIAAAADDNINEIAGGIGYSGDGVYWWERTRDVVLEYVVEYARSSAKHGGGRDYLDEEAVRGVGRMRPSFLQITNLNDAKTVINGLFLGFHYLHEEIKVSTSSPRTREKLNRLNAFLIEFVWALGWPKWILRFYNAEKTGQFNESVTEDSADVGVYPAKLPSIYEYASETYLGGLDAADGPRDYFFKVDGFCDIYSTHRSHSSAFPLLTRVVSVLQTLRSSDHTSRDLVWGVLSEIVNQKFTYSEIEALPLGLSLPIKQILRIASETPPTLTLKSISKLNSQACSMIGREDIAAFLLDKRNMTANRNQADDSVINSVLRMSSSGLDSAKGGSRSESGAADPSLRQQRDPVIPLADFTVSRFNSQMISSIVRILDTTNATKPYLSDKGDGVLDAGKFDPMDHTSMESHQLRLQNMVKRRCVAAIGRGAFYFRVEAALMLADPLTLQVISTKGTIAKGGQALGLNTSSLPEDWKEWPDFHNGCAVGLRLGFARKKVKPSGAKARMASNGGSSASGGGFSENAGASERQQQALASLTQQAPVVSRTWILFNTLTAMAGAAANEAANAAAGNVDSDGGAGAGADLRNAHAGLLLGLGLQGQLRDLQKSDVLSFLKLHHDPTCVAILLGIAASYLGEMEPAVLQMIAVHVPGIEHLALGGGEYNAKSLSQSTSARGSGAVHRGAYRSLSFTGTSTSVRNLNLSDTVQSAALISIGLLYLESHSPAIVSFLLAELGSDSDVISLHAGIAMAMVLAGVGAGGSLPLHFTDIVDILFAHVFGGSREKSMFNARKIAGGVKPSGDMYETCGSRSSLQDYEKYTRARYEELNPEEERRTLSDDRINVIVSSPGAVIVLMFMYIRTNNRAVAGRIALAKSLWELHMECNPFTSLLRVLATALIMWDEIRPQNEWIKSRIPASLREYKLKFNADKVIDDPKSFAFEPSFASNVDPFETLGSQVLISIHEYSLAGACLALGLRFAGSHDVKVCGLLLSYCDYFMDLFKSETNKENQENQDGARRKKPSGIPRSCLYACLNTAVLSLALVAAGSGDSNVFKKFQDVLTLTENRTGPQMAVHMAIGFLFISGGASTFSQSVRATLWLFCAVYPRFPLNTSFKGLTDNYYLQALRHFYVFAASDRSVSAIDISSGRKCSVPVEISVKRQVEGSTKYEKIKRKTPFILPHGAASGVHSMKIVSVRYLGYKLKFERKSSFGFPLVLYVKKKDGHLPYEQDHIGMRNINSHFSGLTLSGAKQQHEWIRGISNEPNILAFNNYVCSATDVGNQREDMSDNLIFSLNPFYLPRLGKFMDNSAVYGRLLRECLLEGKNEALFPYFNLFGSVVQLKREDVASSNEMHRGHLKRQVANVVAILIFYAVLYPKLLPSYRKRHEKSALVMRDNIRLLSPTFLAFVNSEIRNFILENNLVFETETLGLWYDMSNTKNNNF